MAGKKRNPIDEEVPLNHVGTMKPIEECECMTDPQYYEKCLAKAKVNPLIIL